jgi:hypothetical protein
LNRSGRFLLKILSLLPFRLTQVSISQFFTLLLLHDFNKLLISFSTLLNDLKPFIKLSFGIKTDPNSFSFQWILLNIDIWSTIFFLA